MGSLSKFEVLSLNVRGIRDQIKRKSIFSYLKDQKANIFYKEHIQNELKKIFGERMGWQAIFPTWHHA